jgi:hypothetical protein
LAIHLKTIASRETNKILTFKALEAVIGTTNLIKTPRDKGPFVLLRMVKHFQIDLFNIYSSMVID